MGLRSWLTPITEKDQWPVVQSSIEENPYAYGIHYIIKVEKDGTPFPVGSVVVAWSGNGSSSVDELRPLECRLNTWLLDNFLEDDVCPEWHTEPGGPQKFGTALKTDDEVNSAFGD